MGITLKRENLDKKSDEKKYGAALRSAPKLRWYLIVCVISIPLVYLVYLLLDETVLAQFQGVVVFDTVKIRAPDAGYVETLYVKEGEHIVRGRPLLQFKSPELDTRLDYLHKEKARLEERVEAMKVKSTESLQEHLATLKKDILSSQLVYQKFAKYYRSKGNIAAMDLEAARKNVISAKEAYAQLQHQIKQVILENDLEVEVKYRRRIEDIKIEITQAEIKKKYFLIKSPAKGTVKEIDIHRGEFLPEGKDIIDIITKNNLRVVAFIDPKQAEDVQQNAVVSITFPDNFSVKGKVVNVPSYAERTPLTFHNPLATRENKLIAIIMPDKELPKNYRVFGLPVEVDIH